MGEEECRARKSKEGLRGPDHIGYGALGPGDALATAHSSVGLF